MSTPATTSTEATKAVVRQPDFTTREDESGAHLLVALPGVRKEELKITLNQSILHIEANRATNVADGWKTHSGQTDNLIYKLGVRLTANLDGANVKASLENGILALDIPIREEARPREIYVN